MYKRDEVIELLGVNIRTLQRYIQQGDIAITPLRKGYSIQGKAILAFLKLREKEETIKWERQQIRTRNKDKTLETDTGKKQEILEIMNRKR